MKNEAAKYPGEEQKILEFFKNNPQATQQLSAPIFEEKVVDFIFEMIKIKEKKISSDELMKILEDEENNNLKKGDKIKKQSNKKVKTKSKVTSKT